MSSLDVAGTRVEYLEQGQGEPVVLLHSSASSSAQWRTLAGRLSERYRVIAPDLHGYGSTSNWPGRGGFRLEHEAEIVYALLGRAGVRAHLVGHSFGGAVALHVARTRPDLLASLAVIEPVAFHLLRGDDREALAEIEEVASAVRAALASGDYFGGIARFVDYWSGPGAWETMPQEKRPGFTARLGKVALDFEATLNEPAELAEFGAMALPTLVVQGTCSPRPTRRICELLGHVLPDAHTATLEGAGHMSPLTHRDAVSALVIAHLDSVSVTMST
ncbi:MAG: alpha/beta hydrolase [Betaproteobacteria bacterium]|nr:MAG: alpha/beta hydrolase [Betaproteobacteria bacterium]